MSALSFIILMALLGLAAGSFLNVVIDRVPVGQSLLGTSQCPHCRRRIPFYDLVPVANYLWLRGRCRFCQVSIPGRLPLVEAGTGALFAWTAYRFGVSSATAVALLNTCVFLVIAFIDLEHKLILNKVLVVSLPLLLSLFPLGPLASQQGLLAAYLGSLAGAGLGFGALLLVFLLSRGGMGEGDVKMGALVGVAAGFPQVLAALALGFVSAGALALGLLATKKKGRKDTIPFGPFLAAGAVATLLAWEGLASWYSGLLQVMVR